MWEGPAIQVLGPGNGQQFSGALPRSPGPREALPRGCLPCTACELLPLYWRPQAGRAALKTEKQSTLE